ALDPTRDRLCRPAAARHPARRCSFGIACTDAERDRLLVGDHPQWISRRTAGAEGSGSIARQPVVADHLENSATSGISPDDPAARQFGERSVEGDFDYVRHFDGRAHAPQPDADAGKIRRARSVLLRGRALPDDDDRLGPDPAPARNPLPHGIRPRHGITMLDNAHSRLRESAAARRELPFAHLLHGAIDSHVHCAPHINARTVTVFDAVREAAEAGLAGLGIMDVFANTSGLAALATRELGHLGVDVFGGIILEPYVGGIDPRVVENALKMGYGPDSGARF